MSHQPPNAPQNIAIDGGSFDPLHNGHITRLIGIVKAPDFQKLKIEKLIIIPSGSGGRKDKIIRANPDLRAHAVSG